MQENRITVYGIANKLLHKLYTQLESSEGRAILSYIRRSAGKSEGLPMEVLAFIFENFPENYLGKGKGLTYEETAVLSALQLYAIHQQGETRNTHLETEAYSNLGTSLKALRSEDSSAADRRFNAMITSDTYDELITHLRYLIKLLKSKSALTTVNYAALARDLFRFQLNEKEREQIRLNWSREYYRIVIGGNEKDEQ